MKYFINPRKKARRATTGRARTGAALTRKRARKGGKAMATKRRKAVVRRRRRTTTAKRRRSSPVTKLARNRVYQTNPRRRRRTSRRTYRRNPNMGKAIIGTLKDAGAVLVGGAAGRFVSGLIPIGGTPIVDLAKGSIVAIVIRIFGRRFVGEDMARMLAAGALSSPLKNAIVGTVPAASAFLGAYDDQGLFGSYSAGVPALALDDGGMGSYSGGGASIYA